MFNPVSTYRIQFHKDFSFRDFEGSIPYLQKLGIHTIYASPIFEAVPGSTHGYDVVNPLRINPEIGTEEQLRSISGKLKQAGIKWIQDIVPNHMAFHSNNIWLMDVLEKGQNSVYASFFDLAWTSDLFQGRLVVPFLGGSVEDILFNKEITIEYFQQRLVFRYFESTYPVHPRSYATILQADDAPETIQVFVKQITELHSLDDAMNYTMRWHELLLQFGALMNNTDIRNYIEDRLQKINDDGDQLKTVLDEQKYKLCEWQRSDEQINFRRFFTITNLIGVNIRNEKVFDHYHRLIKTLVDDGIFHGLRIDHIDGLYDPTQYLERLRNLVGPEVYIVVEKILQVDEKLPAWPVQGTTGYDFLAYVNNVLTWNESEGKLSSFYNALLKDRQPADEKIWDKKSHILHRHMAGELENLKHFLFDLNILDEATLQQLDPESIKATIAEFLIRCPVYRYYGNQMPLEQEEAEAIRTIFNNIREYKPELETAANGLEDILLNRTQHDDIAYNERVLRFYMRCMQFTGPLMAKGVEDTLMYTYNRFVGHNEVGDSPVFFGITTEEFHRRMRDRQQHWPLAMNATATHDTKRGEDVRSRLNVLPELADEWIAIVKQWQKLNASKKVLGMPDTNDEYFIYQTLIGAYPAHDDTFAQRLEEYIVKSLRESKRNSDWASPNEAYEKSTTDFALRLLAQDGRFWKSFEKFHQTISDFGIVNSLAQVLLKFTCPGIPDLYQGCELWDFSLVDPDNRRPVDYEQRMQWLTEMESRAKEDTAGLLHELWQQRGNARIKEWITYTLLHTRKSHPEAFTEGEYIPLPVEGEYKDHIIAYARRYKKTWYIIAVPLHLAWLGKIQKKSPVDIRWKDTRIVLPPEVPGDIMDLVLNKPGKYTGSLLVKDIFSTVPIAFLRLEHVSQDRNAGILMHITSLPSSYGIGDLGPEAYSFADFLYRSHQTYWQLLPLGPTDAGTQHSPYSAFSSMAGNAMLISPELLVKDNILTDAAIASYITPAEDKVNFETVQARKEQILEAAWENFSRNKRHPLQTSFQRFVETESYWLHDFALYVVLKRHHENRCWCDWPEVYKKRDAVALEQFANEYEESIQFVQWVQFIFMRQWKKLKTYCASLDIQLFGDLPFYMCYDSADVWANPGIFCLDAEGKMQCIAGVPPDYFNANGQLWGMPVYRWDVLKQQGYQWWIQRLRRNMELYELLRLDHFRAFAGYWEVPAGEETAIHGKWQRGPGADLFTILRNEFGELPFVAEDLGEITEDVYELRDAFRLPGMKVLQFAVTDDIGKSMYSPHNFGSDNFIVYTGTHDNNTTAGWFKSDLKKDHIRNLSLYTGISVRENNIHEILIRLAYSSIAKIVIVPLQDILGMDDQARMNMPGSASGNWRWRLIPGKITAATEEQLRQWTKVFNRG
jgi:malto-oligosyltrehalose synthase/4-alpha-glucanotransferase